MVGLPFHSLRRIPSRDAPVWCAAGMAVIVMAGLGAAVCGFPRLGIASAVSPLRFTYIAQGGPFADHVARRLYRSGKYAQAAGLLESGVTSDPAGYPRPQAVAAQQAALVERVHERLGFGLGPVVLAARLQALRYWERERARVAGVMPAGAVRVMGWTSTDLSEVAPVSIAAVQPGLGNAGVLRDVGPGRLIVARDVKADLRSHAQNLQASVAAVVAEPPAKVHAAPALRPAGLGGGVAAKRARPAQAASADGPSAPSGGRGDDWMERVFHH